MQIEIQNTMHAALTHSKQSVRHLIRSDMPVAVMGERAGALRRTQEKASLSRMIRPEKTAPVM